MAGMEVRKSCLDEKLAEENHDFSELGVCLVRWERYRSEVDGEGVMLRGQDYCCSQTSSSQSYESRISLRAHRNNLLMRCCLYTAMLIERVIKLYAG